VEGEAGGVGGPGTAAWYGAAAARDARSGSLPPVTEPGTDPSPGSATPPGGSGRRRHVLRRIGAAILLVVVFLAAPVTAVTLYTRNQVLDTDRYVETVEPLASNPAVQAYVADRLTREVFARLEVEQRARRLLPGPTDVLAGPLRNAAEARVRDALEAALRTEMFTRVWAEANRAAHAELRHLLTGEGRGALVGRDDGAISVDLSEALVRLRTHLGAVGIDVPSNLTLGISGRVTIYRFDDLYRARRAVRALNRAAYVFPVVLALAAVGAVLLLPNRRRAVVAAAVALIAGMGLLGVGLAVGRGVYLDGAVDHGMPRDAAAALYDTLARRLVTSVRVTLIAGVAVIVVALLAGAVIRVAGSRRRTGRDASGVAA